MHLDDYSLMVHCCYTEYTPRVYYCIKYLIIKSSHVSPIKISSYKCNVKNLVINIYFRLRFGFGVFDE